MCSEYPHTFTSKLKGQTVVEHDRAEFEIDVEAADAEVTWYRDGRKINPEQVMRESTRPSRCVDVETMSFRLSSG